LGDRLDKRRLAAGGMLLRAAAMATLTFLPNLLGAVAAVVMHGLAWGLRGPLMSALRADYFGRAAFAMVMGFSSLIVTVGSVLGPLLVGLLADGAGGYAWGFGVLVVVGLTGAMAFLLLERPPARTSVVARTGRSPPPAPLGAPPPGTLASAEGSRQAPSRSPRKATVIRCASVQPAHHVTGPPRAGSREPTTTNDRRTF